MAVRRDPEFADPDEAVRFLKKALAAVDVTLPSLKVDLPSTYWSFAPPLIDLGRCTIDTAYRIADGLHRSVGAAEGLTPQPSRAPGAADQ
ncbi:hypothetical protein [Streptomyces sp. MAR4 CNX-425]|uniref:hypothetical protein n=1 Tax=Streptomyces sp. MAR4 CNX-425 TaxID=3406343 RepID=UPI003B5069CB